MDTNKIHGAMLAIMRDVPAIGKDSRNQQQNFNFRGIDAVYNELHALMAKHGVYTTSDVLSEHHEERQTAKGGTLLYRIYRIAYTFHAEDGSSVTSTVVGEGMDSGDKASNKALAIAHKYALLQAFMVPTSDMPDPDAESHEVTRHVPSMKEITEGLRACQTMAELVQKAKGYRPYVITEEDKEIMNAVYTDCKAKLNEGA